MTETRLSMREFPVVPEDIDVHPDELLSSIARLIVAWPGIRDPQTPFLCAANKQGTKPPLFWVMQAGGEFARIAATLPADQPVYGLKSVFMGEAGFRREDATSFMVSPFIDAVSAAFLKDIRKVAGDRPYVLAGNCTGSVSALDIALRAETAPQSLILMNYPMPARPYLGRVELIFGTQEWAEFQEVPTNVACFPRATVTLLEGAHGTYFTTDQLFRIVDVVERSAMATG